MQKYKENILKIKEEMWNLYFFWLLWINFITFWWLVYLSFLSFVPIKYKVIFFIIYFLILATFICLLNKEEVKNLYSKLYWIVIKYKKDIELSLKNKNILNMTKKNTNIDEDILKKYKDEKKTIQIIQEEKVIEKKIDERKIIEDFKLKLNEIVPSYQINFIMKLKLKFKNQKKTIIEEIEKDKTLKAEENNFQEDIVNIKKISPIPYKQEILTNFVTDYINKNKYLKNIYKEIIFINDNKLS